MSNNLSLEPRRTTFGAIVQTANWAGLPVNYMPGTTLNEKFDFAVDTPVEDGDRSELNYFSCGRGSTYMSVLSDGTGQTSNYLHEPLDAALHNSIPFALREKDNDLTAEQRELLGGRCLYTHNGIEYVAYMLKKLDKTSSVVTASSVIPATEASPERVTEVVPDTRYLNPTLTKPEAGNIRTDGAYVRVNAVLVSKLEAWVIDEILNAKQILTGNSQLEITEMGLYTAIPKLESNSITGSNVVYTEAVKAQLNLVAPQRILLNQYVGRDLILNHDVGVDDPTTFNFIS